MNGKMVYNIPVDTHFQTHYLIIINSPLFVTPLVKYIIFKFVIPPRYCCKRCYVCVCANNVGFIFFIPKAFHKSLMLLMYTQTTMSDTQ